MNFWNQNKVRLKLKRIEATLMPNVHKHYGINFQRWMRVIFIMRHLWAVFGSCLHRSELWMQLMKNSNRKSFKKFNVNVHLTTYVSMTRTNGFLCAFVLCNLFIYLSVVYRLMTMRGIPLSKQKQKRNRIFLFEWHQWKYLSSWWFFFKWNNK